MVDVLLQESLLYLSIKISVFEPVNRENLKVINNVGSTALDKVKALLLVPINYTLTMKPSLDSLISSRSKSKKLTLPRDPASNAFLLF